MTTKSLSTPQELVRLKLAGYEPVSVNVAIELLDLLDRARRHVSLDDETPLTDQSPETQSLVFQRMLELTKEKGEVLKSCQAWMVAQLSRTGVWMAHPDGYTSLRQFLVAAGMTHTDVSLLVGLGEKVVPFCDDKGIDVDPLLTDENWGRLREGMAAAKAAVESDDTDTMQELFEDVKKAPDRNAIRDKWQKHRTVLGHGTSWQIDGQEVFVIVAGDEESETSPSEGAEALRDKLRGKVKWDLTIYEDEANGRLKIAQD